MTAQTAVAPLAVDRMWHRYGRVRPWALANVSLDVPRGSITALVGANGAGKSTLIRSCLGFEQPSRGRVLVFGTDPRRNRVSAVQSIGYVPQGSSLYRGLTIADHFAMAQAGRPGFDPAFASAHVRAAGLHPERRLADLSGGEQAQVALALALATRSPLLLLDEPLANLDPLARRDFLTALVFDVRQRGATAVLSSHIVTDVEQACDRLAVLAAGELVLHESIAEARATYRIVENGATVAAPAVGQFAGPAGGELILVRGGADGRAASLEEIVLGHLAKARSTRLTA